MAQKVRATPRGSVFVFIQGAHYRSIKHKPIMIVGIRAETAR